MPPSDLPKPLRVFLEQDDAALLVTDDAAPPGGEHPRVGLRVRDVGALRALRLPEHLRSATVGVFLTHADAALGWLPGPEVSDVERLRSRPAGGGWWTVVRLGAPAPVAAVVEALLAGSARTWGAWSVLPPSAPDVGVLNPRGYLVEAPERALPVGELDLSDGVTPALVARLRAHRGVRVAHWDERADVELEGLALAGVPVVAERAVGPLAAALMAPLDLDDGSFEAAVAREEHSIVLRRAALDRRLPSRPPVSLLLATRRPEMLDFAVEQVARQRDVELELVLAPHGFDVGSEQLTAIRERLGRHALQVVPAGAATLFGDVLHAAAQAASASVLLKIDDDDWYAPDAVADLLRARAYSGAELVGMPAEVHYLTGPDVTVRRGHTVEHFARFVAGGTLLLDRDALASAGGFRPVTKFVDAQLIDGVLAAGGAVYRTHGQGYLLRRNPSGHTWQVDDDYLLDPARTRSITPGFAPGRLMGDLHGR